MKKLRPKTGIALTIPISILLMVLAERSRAMKDILSRKAPAESSECDSVGHKPPTAVQIADIAFLIQGTSCQCRRQAEDIHRWSFAIN